MVHYTFQNYYSIFLLLLVDDIIFLYFFIGQISVGCPEPSTLYEELGCIPSFRNPNSQCAFAYDCDSVFNRDKSHCFFQGDTYMVNEPISSNKLGRSCFRDCGCERGTDG